MNYSELSIQMEEIAELPTVGSSYIGGSKIEHLDEAHLANWTMTELNKIFEYVNRDDLVGTPNERGFMIYRLKDTASDDTRFMHALFVLYLKRVKALIDRISLDCLRKSLEILSKVTTLSDYTYCCNKEKYCAITRLVMQRLEILDGEHINKYVSEAVANVIKWRDPVVSHFAFEKKYTRGEFENFETDFEEYIRLITDFERNADASCPICLKSEPRGTIVHPCKCKCGIHTACFIEYLCKSQRADCATCGERWLINEPRGGMKPYDQEVFFPFEDIYPVPLMSHYAPCKVPSNARLYYATIYLQLARIVDLLKNETFTIGELRMLIRAVECPPSNYHCHKSNAFVIDYIKFLFELYIQNLEAQAQAQ